MPTTPPSGSGRDPGGATAGRGVCRACRTVAGLAAGTVAGDRPGEAHAAELLDAAGHPVAVSGRGELSADPATLVVGGRPPLAITGWAGPWPLDERWWDPAATVVWPASRSSPPTAPPTSCSPSTAPGGWRRGTTDERSESGVPGE